MRIVSVFGWAVSWSRSQNVIHRVVGVLRWPEEKQMMHERQDRERAKTGPRERRGAAAAPLHIPEK